MEAAIETIPIGEHTSPGDLTIGSREAWRVLYDQLGEKVFRLTYRLTGDADLAADLTHDTFVLVHERGHQFTGRGSAAGWVYRIATNLAKERLRRDASRRRKLSEAHAGSASPRTQRQPDTELQIVLRRALQQVPEDHRRVVLLHDVDGYTHAEIAAMLDIAVGSSKARLSRARAMLRTALKNAM